MTISTSAPRSAIRAIVTGQTRGLGEALAQSLLQRDIEVLGLGRGVHAELASRHPERFSQAVVDLADSAALERWLAGDTLDAFAVGAQCVLLFNNAGSVEPIAPLGAQDPIAIARAVTLNVAAPLMLANALAATPSLSAGTERRIVHISSGAGRNAYPGWSVYCATKAALDHHARAVALDAPTGVRICSIAPGVIDTGMQQTIRATSVDQFPMRERFEQLKQNGLLSSPETAAQQLIDHALSEAFGSVPVTDVRELGKA